MALTLHYHPLSSYCHKVLIALDELGIEVDKRLLNLGDPAERSAFLELWPTGKMPLLVDDGRVVPETSIAIEYLQRYSQHRLIPDEADAALDVRLWDRLFDLYVMTPMQARTSDLLRPEADRDPINVAEANAKLLMAYGMIDHQLAGRTWVTGEAFTLADCAAAPSLFYAVTYVAPPPELRHLAAYVERLMARPSVARTIEQAKPFFKYYPGRAGLAKRFYDPATA
ncbi:glutathione S-transferase family protein [Piscinibacter gummiphilus]|uniref:Glutathione S-transferase family protein n=1 Tax=Piscinibacter gummiphilus TaxID=946333 RepID=A0ABZ0D2F8_9BURK|nr:glutathione S-transferase family protein [Piscinibacter gummiphilus]WOB09510.1 glutathione S-transferase family protein [Piscinibacter gummiphilus]